MYIFANRDIFKMTERIADKALQLPPITLEEMSGIKLMNRTDT